MSPQQGIDRRRDSVVKNIVLPVVVAVITAVIVGMGSATLAIKIGSEVLITRVNYMERDIVEVRELVNSLGKVSISLAENTEWQRGTDKVIDGILINQRGLQEMTKDRYPRAEAKKDLNIVYGRIDKLEEVVDRIRSGSK